MIRSESTGRASATCATQPFDTVLQQYVRGFEVAVNQALGMSGGQAVSGLHPDPQDLAELQGTLAIELLLERLPVDVLLR